MNHIWKFVYLAGAVACVLGGYRSLAPDRTANTNADWIFVTLSFGITCIFPLGAMAYSRRCWGVEVFRRPSLDRHPIGWWRDTLQPIRVSLVAITLTFIGACFAVQKADHKGVMMFWFYAALTLGWFIGERLVYRITNLALLYFDRGLAKAKKRDLKGAMDDFNQTIELKPNYSQAYDSRGNLERAEDYWDSALADYNKSIDLNPKYVIAYTDQSLGLTTMWDSV